MSAWRQFGPWLFQRGDVVRSDTLFVFGTPHHIYEFAIKIHELWTSLGLRNILISGHNGEAEQIMLHACLLGIPPDAIYTERNASNTKENIVFSVDILNRLCADKGVHILAKLYAAPRALLTMRKVLPGWKVAVHWVNYFPIDFREWWKCEPFLIKATDEITKILLYSESGEIDLEDFETFMSKAKEAGILKYTCGVDYNEGQGCSIGGHFQRSRAEALLSERIDAGNIGDDQKKDNRYLSSFKYLPNIAVIVYDVFADEVIFAKRDLPFRCDSGGNYSMITLLTQTKKECEGNGRDLCRELLQEFGIRPGLVLDIRDSVLGVTESSAQADIFCTLVDLHGLRFGYSYQGIENCLVNVPFHELNQAIDEGKDMDFMTQAATQWLFRARTALRRLATEYPI